MARKSGGKNERKGTRADTIKERQDELKAKFISKLLETPIIQVAAAQTGIDRTTYYRWRDEDPVFKKQCHDAQTRGVEFVNDMMESILIKNAKADNMTAVIFWLKNHHLVYSEKLKHEYEINLKQETVLSPERIKEIAMAMSKWSEAETGDERDEDYESPDIELTAETEQQPSVKRSAKVVEQHQEPPQKRGVARMYRPKR
jgi:hypothetical protein